MPDPMNNFEGAMKLAELEAREAEHLRQLRMAQELLRQQNFAYSEVWQRLNSCVGFLDHLRQLWIWHLVPRWMRSEINELIRKCKSHL